MEKKAFGILAFLLLLCCFSVTALAAKSTPAIATATATAAYTPGGSSGVRISEGTKLNVYGTRTVNRVQYCKIYRGGRYCWIRAAFVYMTDAAAPRAADRVGQGTAWKTAAVYEQPSRASRRLGSISAGKVRNLYAQSGNWYQIYTGGRYAWVRCDGFVFTKSVQRGRLGQYTTKQALQGHYGPSVVYEKSDVIPEGKTVNFYRKEGSWLMVYRGGRFFWINEKVKADTVSKNGYRNGERISLDPAWQYAGSSAIHSGQAVMYLAKENRKNIIIAVNAGHGTCGGEEKMTWCHPDHSAKLVTGSTAAGSVKAKAVTNGMTFRDGTGEAAAALRLAQILKEILLARGYDVLMLRDGADVQLDNVARTVIANNVADCHIALHWDTDGMTYDKGCFYVSVPAGLKSMAPVKNCWPKHEALGGALVAGLRGAGCTIFGNGRMEIDLTQTSYSTIPSVDIELGNTYSRHDDATLRKQAEGLANGIDAYF